MAKRTKKVQIPAPRRGRPLSEEAKRVIAMKVGGREPFDLARRDAVRTLASSWGKKLGRTYVTRIEDDKTIAVWRAA